MQKIILAFLLLTACVLAQTDPVPQLKEKGGYETYLAISPDGRYAAVNHSQTVSVWNVDTRKLIHTMKGFERVSSVRFTPDSKSIVVADYPRWIGYFDLTNGFQKRWEFKAPWSGGKDVQNAGSYGLQFSPDGSKILAADSSHGAQTGDPDVRMIATKDGRVLHSHPKWGGRPYRSELAFVDDSVFVRGRDDKLQLYSVATGEKLKEVRLEGKIHFLGVDDEGIACQYYVNGSSKPVRRLYSKADLHLIKELGESRRPSTTHPSGELSWLGKDGRTQILRGEKVVYETTDGQALGHWAVGSGFIIAHEDGSPSTLYDKDGKKLADIDPYCRYFAEAPVAVSIKGYGSECSLLDLTRGKELANFSFASDAEVSGDGHRMIVLLKTGVLVIDLKASLQKGQLVLL